jgi:O-antigen/teichoic acid export membrane protein
MVQRAASRRAYPTTRTVAFGALWNVAGRAAPQLVAVVTTPLLINMLGPSRWGVFSLAMALVGISGLLDLGIGRALTRGLAERLHAGNEDQAATLVKTGLLVLGALGVLGGLLAAAGAHPVAYHVINVKSALRHETEMTLYVICLTIPTIVVNGALWGVISALDLFRAANIANVVISALTYAGQLLILYACNSLAAVMLVFLVGRVASLLVYWKLCHDALPSLGDGAFSRADLRPLMRIGGWMTVSNVVFPILTYADRVVIASVLSAEAIGYYATPSDLMARVHIVTGATVISLFPAIAASYRTDPARAVALFGRSVVTVSAVLFPAAVLVGVFSNELLTLWIGADYASHAAPVLRILAVGTLVGAADSIAATLLDAIGLPRVNAKLSVCELIVYVPVLFFALHLFGFLGGAITQVVRMTIDFHIRIWLARRYYPPVAAAARRVTLTVLSGTALLLAPMAFAGLADKCAAVVVVTLLYGSFVYARSATAEERLRVRSRMAALVPAAWSR